VSQYQKSKTNLDFTAARDSEWQWHQLGFRQITMPASHHSVFLQARCPSCRPTNSVKALKATKKIMTKTLKLLSVLKMKMRFFVNLRKDDWSVNRSLQQWM